MPIDPHRRLLEPEQMDHPNLDAGVHEQALRGLARINRWSGSAGILWPAICELTHRVSRKCRLLDVATGAGDVPLALFRKARQAGLLLEVQGCDRSEQAVAFARQRAGEQDLPVSFFSCNALTEELPTGFDILTCSLFLHHLEEAAAVELLRLLARAAGALVLVNDLRRCRLGFATAWAGTRLLSRSPIVHFDGPQSVAAAFTLEEARSLAARAGLQRVGVEPRWPFRWLLCWEK